MRFIIVIFVLVLESQEQVLANLANFAYDPLNYKFLREAKVIDLFVGGLRSRNPYFVQFGLKGICNLANDPLNQDSISKLNGLVLLIFFSSSLHSSGKNNIHLKYLIYFCRLNLFILSEIRDPTLIASVQEIHNSSQDSYIKNLAQIFLEKVAEHLS